MLDEWFTDEAVQMSSTMNVISIMVNYRSMVGGRGAVGAFLNYVSIVIFETLDITVTKKTQFS